jgi:hypothetical protein
VTKRRITLIVDESVPGFGFPPGVTIESSVEIPEPIRVQEFRVRVETDPDLPPWTRDRLDYGIRFTEHMQGGTRLTVTEVEPT